MGIRITGTASMPHYTAALYDSVTGMAFGPVFDSNGDAEDFLEWYAEHSPPTFKGRDLRSLLPSEVADLKEMWEEDWLDSQDDEDPPTVVVGVYEGGRLHVEVDDDREYDLAKESGEL